jgi:hypothetical protein
MRLKIQEQRELNFVSRIIQSRRIGIGNCPALAGQGKEIKKPLAQLDKRLLFFSL